MSKTIRRNGEAYSMIVLKRGIGKFFKDKRDKRKNNPKRSWEQNSFQEN